MADVLIYAGTSLMAAGQIQQGRVAEREGSMGYKIGLYNQQIREREARAIEQKTRLESRKQAERARDIYGRLRTKLAASGAQLGVGATEALEEKQLAELELENMMIGYEGQQAAARQRELGKMDVFQGIMAKKRGRVARKASYIGAGASLLTGFGLARGYGGGSSLSYTRNYGAY